LHRDRATHRPAPGGGGPHHRPPPSQDADGIHHPHREGLAGDGPQVRGPGRQSHRRPRRPRPGPTVRIGGPCSAGTGVECASSVRDFPVGPWGRPAWYFRIGSTRLLSCNRALAPPGAQTRPPRSSCSSSVACARCPPSPCPPKSAPTCQKQFFIHVFFWL